METPDWTDVRRPWLAALVGGTLLGLAMGMLGPVPRAAADDVAGADWRVPHPDTLARSDERLFSQLRKARFWGGGGSMNDGAGNRRVEWRLTGIIADPVPTVLVLAAGDSQTVSLHVGDRLPGGGEILAITAEAVEFQQDGCRQSRVLYAQAKSGTGDPCAPKP